MFFLRPISYNSCVLDHSSNRGLMKRVQTNPFDLANDRIYSCNQHVHLHRERARVSPTTVSER